MKLLGNAILGLKINREDRKEVDTKLSNMGF